MKPALPPEMWREIFLRLENTKDMLNCSEVCKTWFQIVREDPFLLRGLRMKYWSEGLYNKDEKIKFLQAFKHLRVLRTNGVDLPFVKSKDHDIRAVMENIAEVIFDNLYPQYFEEGGSSQKLRLKDGKLPAKWYPKTIILETKSFDDNADIELFGLDQVLKICIKGDYSSEGGYFNEQWPLVDEYAKSAKELVNLKHLDIEKAPSNENEELVFASIRSPNLKSVNLKIHEINYPEHFSGDPCPSVRKLHLNCDTSFEEIEELSTWFDTLAKKYPKVSQLSVELYLDEFDIPKERVLTTLEIMSSSFLELTEIKVEMGFGDIPTEEHKLLPAVKVTKERVQEFFSERVLFNMSFHIVTGNGYDPWDKYVNIKVVKQPFEDPKYHIQPIDYDEDERFVMDFLCRCHYSSMSCDCNTSRYTSHYIE